MNRLAVKTVVTAQVMKKLICQLMIPPQLKLHPRETTLNPFINQH
jgi:hypothetical protein